VLKAGFSYRLPQALLLGAVVLLPLSVGGNGALGLALGLILVPAILLYCLASGGIRPSPAASALLALYLIVALAMSTYFYPSMKTATFIVSGLSAFGVSAYLARREGSWRLLVGAMTASALLVALYGLFLYSPHLSGVSAEHKLASTFGLHNSAAAFFLLTWPLGLALIGRRRDVAFALGGFVLVLALVLTFSRAAYIALALQLLWLATACLPASRTRSEPSPSASERTRVSWLAVALGIVVIALVALGFGGFFGSVGERIASIFNAADYSLRGRFTFWSVAFRMFADSPVFGVGLGNFGFHFTYLQPNWYYYATDAHGLVFKFLAEGGLVGLAFLVGVGWLFLHGVNRSAKAHSILRGYPRLLLGTALFGFFIHSLVDFDWTYLANVVFFGLLAGMMVAERPSADENLPGPESGRHRAPFASRTAVLLIALGLVVQVAAGAGLALERLWLDRARDTGQTEALKRAAAAMPVNASTRIGVALKYMNERPPAFELARREVRAALSLNPYESQAYFLLSQIPMGALADRIDLARKAIELDPYNRPPYYLGLSRLYRSMGDEEAERSILTLADHRFAITERITPDFPRPLWIEYNVTFAAMYRRLAELYAGRDAGLSKLYWGIAARFEEEG